MDIKLKLRPIVEIINNQTPDNEESYWSKTIWEQVKVEKHVLGKFEDVRMLLRVDSDEPELFKEQHKKFLSETLTYLSPKYESLDASRAWICYWVLHPLSLMGVRLDNDYKNKIVEFIAKCQSPLGGFGGGPGQYPHLAPTYAAINALVILGTNEAYEIIDREKLYEFLLSIKQADGSFAMHVGGEVDIRGAYCALSVASLTNTLTEDLARNTAQWIASCQTYEGGFGGCPGLEAHGGYSFCGLAALIILNKGHLCDLSALLRWLVQKQMKLEGGFQGRTNKLVDSCYSFWQGGAFPLIYTLLANEGFAPKDHLFDERALQEYILMCCQNPQGGLIDKPGKPRDPYHTCYSLSGLSLAQHFLNEKRILGTYRNELTNTHPIHNIRPDLVRRALLYFHGRPNES